MEYRADVDVLRAIAVVFVVLFHAQIQIFKGGFIGVDMFLVISGFIVTKWILYERARGLFSFGRFYEKRVRRIAPAVTFLIFSVTKAVLYLMPREYCIKYFWSLVAIVTFNSNHYFFHITDYFERGQVPQVMLHTWTLALEEQFYFFLPILILYTGSYITHVACGVTLASFAGCIYMQSIGYSSAAFYLLPPRAWEFLVGVLLAHHDRKLFAVVAKASAYIKIIGYCGIFGSLAIFDRGSVQPGWRTVFIVLSTALVILGGTRPDRLSHNTDLCILTLVGKISYSIYLWHQPLFMLSLENGMMKREPQTITVLIVVLFLLSYASWRFVEQPFRLKSFITTANVVRLWIACSFLIAAFSIVQILVLTNDVETSEADTRTCNIRHCCRNMTTIEFRPDNWTITEELPYTDKHEFCPSRSLRHNNTCVLGNETYPVKGAIIGDSHALMMVDAVHEALIQSNLGMSFLHLAIDAELFALDIDCPNRGDKNKTSYERLAQLIDWPDVQILIVANRWTYYAHDEVFDNGEGGASDYLMPSCKAEASDGPFLMPIYTDAFVKTIHALLSLKRKVILVYQTPEAGWVVPFEVKAKVVKSEHGFLTVSMQKNLEWRKPITDAFDNITHPNLIRFDPILSLCDGIHYEGRCLLHDCQNTYFFDSNHLSVEGSMMLVDQLVATLTDAVNSV